MLEPCNSSRQGTELNEVRRNLDDMRMIDLLKKLDLTVCATQGVRGARFKSDDLDYELRAGTVDEPDGLLAAGLELGHVGYTERGESFV